ncbi:unnamed protein product [Closterium sp. Yama58-4]|nr:unnamed protein product [Closterium sp. Yama58-4]
MEPLSPQQLREWYARRTRLQSRAASSAVSRGAEPERVEPGGAEPAGAEPKGVEPGGAEPGDAGPRGAAAGGAEPRGAASGGAELAGAESGSPVPGGAAFAGVSSLELEALELVALALERLEALTLEELETLQREVLELEALGLEALELDALELVALALEPLEALTLEELETLHLEVLELEALALEALELEAMTLVALELEPLDLETLALEALEALELEVLWLLALEALELELSELPPESVLHQALSLPSSTALPPDSPLPAPPRYTEQPVSLTERREPASRPASPVRTVRRARRVPRPRPPPVPGTHTMALRPSSVPQRVPLPSPPASSLLDVPDPASDLIRAASPTVTRLLATVVTDPSFESTTASAIVAGLVDFAAACRLDYATSLVAESESVCPPSVGGECALGTDILEDRLQNFDCLAAAVPHLMAWLLAPEGDPDALDIPTPRSYAEVITGPYSSQWHTAMDAEMASWKSIGTYVDEVPPPGANIVDGMWIFRVKRPSGSPPVFKARYVARGFSQRQRVDFFQTFSPTPKMTTLRVLLHVAAQRDYELHSLDFSTAFLQGSLHEEIWLRRPPSFTGSFPAGTQWSLRRPVYGLR